MGSRRFLVTAALPYSNGRLHVGHIAGAYLPSDIYVRYLRAIGDDVRFICGSDDNGVANLIAARKENTTPAELSARYNAKQKKDFAGLGIEFDIYGGTHQPEYVELHNRLSQELFKSVYDKGYFTKRTQKQLYDPEAGMFLADRYVTGTCPHCGHPSAYGDQCENCGSQIDQLTLIDPKSTITGAKPEVRETAHWYLRLDKLEDRLREWLSGHRDRWRQTVISFCMGQMTPALRVTFASAEQKDAIAGKLPAHEAESMSGEHEWRLKFATREACLRAAELLEQARVAGVEKLGGLPERAMTRDLDWGVPVPLDDPDAAGKVLYVWFDAPIGYVSFTAKWCEEHEGDWQGYKIWWKDPNCKIVHFIGEDNIVFHALTWPAMLMADGTYQLPDNVVANSFLNIKFPGKDEEKISKSRGTAVWIEEYLKTFDPDPLRFYLTAIAPESARTAFDIDDFVQRNNSELIATLGNFFNRWQKIATDDFGRKLPAIDESLLTDEDRRILNGLVDADATSPVEDEVGALIDACKFKEGLKRVMQFAMACNQWIDAVAPWKTRKTDRARTAVTIRVCAHASLRLGTIMGPYLPFASANVRSMLGLEAGALKWSDASRQLPAGHTLGEPVVLFRKIDPGEMFGEEKA